MNVPFYGFAVMCTDHPVVQSLVGKLEDRRILTYGTNPQADVRLVDLDHHDGASRFSVQFRDRNGAVTHTIDKLTLPMPGRHNALNATSAMAVAHQLGIKDDVIRTALAKFGGVKRRFTRVGEWNGVTIIDDYGHHPVEIAAVLRAARESVKGKVIAVVQPHRYTRLHDLFEQFCTCFNDADTVIIAPVYAAGEAADRRRRPRLAGRGPALARPSPGVGAGGAGEARRHDQGPRRAGRLCRLSRRRLDHAMGLRAAGRTRGAGLKPLMVAHSIATTSWPGLSRPSTFFWHSSNEDVDARHKAGHDGGEFMTFPDIVPELKRRLPNLRGRLHRQSAARRVHLVSRRRAGAGAVHAGGRERSRLRARAICRTRCPSPSSAPART